ncbi:hypothetical protein [Falsihalocynthiibacter arcticus]|uniref:Cyanovirin-N domain-containing protein n=1 Tax=Falsihalocynthiibacter arcticus TaxID=1579316 RepID=A0A126V4Z4_9RHOB|nr:hypothetical protein [Falsihalocynthiibacter arcticus]AML53370.1 hypothetical protein RC74_20815 [Falsihalocynthiibacter arcticus]
MMRQLCLTIALTCIAPIGAVAEQQAINDGIYDAYDCSVPISDQRVEITGNKLAFYESSCDLSNPQSILGLERTTIFDADCQGEGETWTTRFILKQTQDGGIAMMDETWGDHYARCN